ncbi:D-glycero-beta-D-manno-heptose 1-phosphate adenylyltransferase [Acidithiobacillus thiooxidans]|uniref:D-glycero-beta-D-manno-heptose 1-phosphate adenylyltransferase n=1 Tax=Acidithiobacillus thiooxidans TaxID=930 RepID=UPI001C0796B7|nr:D-glycero-beta-D-manno-heptose 1-phosphate adenylyltransferase [Acidithiobacillus thiooxidans]MBU2840966.1 D-glycero-beta-D-manno-heptose 1-phosphate adenylyltransferase [Acidithiobacillus thiooxidans]
MTMPNRINTALRASIATKEHAAQSLAAPFADASARLIATLQNGGQVLCCGNGGSSGDAQHLASELVNRFESNRMALPAVALSTDSSVLTAIANDSAYPQVFARQVEALGRPGDCLVAFSTSGNSENVLQAIRTARARGMWTLAMTGKDGGQLAGLLGAADIELRVPETSTARIQEVHLVIIHALCSDVDAAFAENPIPPHSVASFSGRILHDRELLRQACNYRRPLVFTNGVFDVLHRGHVQYLAEARAEGACLVVAVNSDASVRRLGKGADRPINPEDDRMAVLAALQSVDFVTTFDEDTPLQLIEKLQPDVLIKGGDWPVERIVGAREVQARGGRVLSIPFRHERSTSALLQKIRNSRP